MPYRVSWYVPDHIVYALVSGNLDTREAVAVIRELAEHAAQSEAQRVHYIVDMLRMKGKPLDVGKLQDANKQHQPANSDWSLLITKNGIYKAGAKVASLVSGQRLRVFDSVPDALRFLRSDDTAINWDAARKAVLQKR
jgi:hypothetical protein